MERLTVGAMMRGSGVEVGGICVQFFFLFYLFRWVVFQSYYINGLIFNVYIYIYIYIFFFVKTDPGREEGRASKLLGRELSGV